MIAELARRAALIGLATVPGFFGGACERPRETQSDYPPPPPPVSDSVVRAGQTGTARAEPTRAPAAQPRSEAPLEEGWEVYDSLTLPFRVNRPKNWRVLGNNVFSFPTGDASISIGRDSREINPSATLEYYANHQEQELLSFPDAKIRSRTKIMVDGKETIRITATIYSFNRYMDSVYIKHGGAFWRIGLASESSLVDIIKPAFEKMLSSLKFL